MGELTSERDLNGASFHQERLAPIFVSSAAKLAEQFSTEKAALAQIKPAQGAIDFRVNEGVDMVCSLGGEHLSYLFGRVLKTHIACGFRCALTFHLSHAVSCTLHAQAADFSEEHAVGASLRKSRSLNFDG